jgi:hypothetical protein
MTLLPRTSSDQVSYTVAQTPCVVRFDASNYCGSVKTRDGYTFHHLFVPCEQLRTVGLPLDANPREPTRAKVVKEMSETLREAPERFHHWNNGITVVCDDVGCDKEQITLQFNEGSGVCNGGHTYFTINTFPQPLSPQALVHIEAIALPQGMTAEGRRVAINSIAKYRNANRALLPTTQADFLGHYDPFKLALGAHSTSVRWHEGDSNASQDAIASETLVRMLAAVDPLWFKHQVHTPHRDNHKSAATSSSAIHSRWFDGQGDPETNLKHMSLLTVDVFRIAEMLSYVIKNGEFSRGFRNTLFYGWLTEGGDRTLVHYRPGETGAKLPNPATIMMLGAFRSDVCLIKNEEGYASLVGLLDDPEQLWLNNYQAYLDQLMNMFGDKDQNPLLFVKSDGPYDLQLMALEHGRHLPDTPSVLADVLSGCRYQATDDPAAATHQLLIDSEWYGELAQITGKPSASKLYRLC